MPAPVPPGYTRGPIILTGSTYTSTGEAHLLQRFWAEAGGYGARVLYVSTTPHAPALMRQQGLLHSWEVERIDHLAVTSRREMLADTPLDAIDCATAILIADDDPALLARRLGGTAVAQAIRRANARNKCVAGMGQAASLLCQHIPLKAVDGAVHFAPGLGLVNRLTIRHHHAERWDQAISELRATVAPNPFLVAATIGPDTGVVIYPDTTLEAFGDNKVILLDGSMAESDNISASTAEDMDALDGVQVYELTAGYTFNFDRRSVAPPSASDIPPKTTPDANTSSF
jgi:cyanophycinase